MAKQTDIVIAQTSIEVPVIVIRADILQRVDALSDQLDFFELVSDKDMKTGDAFFSDLYALRKEIEKQRKEIKAPVMELGKKIDEAAKPILERLKELEKNLGTKIKAYEAERQKQMAVAQAQLQERKDKGEQNLPEKVEAPKSSATKTVTRKKVVIEDEGKIPLRINNLLLWKTPDTAKIKILLENGFDVPGCKLIEETTVEARG